MNPILLVDDVDLFLELEKSFLLDCGYPVATARSGEEALARMAQEPPSLVLLDLYLPGIDGDEVCRRLRADERWRGLPVIMVTAAGREEEIRNCLQAGCDDYLTKPINKKELVEKVQRLLGQVKGRTAERVPVSLRVQLRGDGKKIVARVRDISSNGLYVKSRTVLDPGAAVELDIELPDGGRLPVLGKVKRVQKGTDGGMGIYLIRPEGQGMQTLDRLVQESLAAASPGPGIAGRRRTPEERRLAELEEENGRLRRRIAELEEENREFAEQAVRTEDINNSLTNLYIASSRLHSVLDRQEVMAIINEVVINFVGAEKFALLFYEDDTGLLRFGTGEGFEAEGFPAVSATVEPWLSVVKKNESYFQEGSVAAGSDDCGQPLVAIPLRIRDRLMGVLAIYRLLVQKEEFAPLDYQLFSMMGEHAATALFTSGLYQESERKRQTYQGFMELLLK